MSTILDDLDDVASYLARVLNWAILAASLWLVLWWVADPPAPVGSAWTLVPCAAAVEFIDWLAWRFGR